MTSAKKTLLVMLIVMTLINPGLGIFGSHSNFPPTLISSISALQLHNSPD